MVQSFLSSLFDFGFDSLITPRIISIVYGIAMFFLGLGALASVFTAFGRGFLVGVGALVIAPIVFGLGLILARIYCELVIALFKIAENTSALKNNPS